MRPLPLAAVTALAAALLAVPVSAGPSLAAAAPGHDRLVKSVPSAYTPHIADGRVYAIADLGTKVIVGGSFTKVSSKGSSTVLTRRYLFAFDKATGAVDSGFTPQLDGAVYALLAGPTSGSVFAGGSFKYVNGAARRGLALLSTGAGGRITSFAPSVINGTVRDLVAHGTGRLLIGGSFTSVGGASRKGLASLDRSTGALTSFLKVALTEHHNYDGAGAKGAVGAVKLALAPNLSRLVVIGNFRKANGLDRDQVAVLDTGGTSATVSSWQTEEFKPACSRSSFDYWVRDVAYAPDGAFFVVVTTGGIHLGTLCDTASRWSATASGAGRTPTWVNASGGDTFLSVAITEQAVYVGGHIRWVNNPTGRDAAQPGAIGRASIAALDPANGLPYTWNPGRNPRGYGVTDLLATPSGLWLGYDTDYLGNFQYARKRIGFFPLSGGAPVPPANLAGLPGPVYLAAEGTGSAVTTRYYSGPGQVAQSRQLPSSGGVDWRNARGAFWVGGELFYGMSDGQLRRRSFDGSAWGTASLVDPYHDNDGVRPDWDEVSHGKGGTYAGAAPDFYGAELSTVTGMFYYAGRLYYTRTGFAGIYWRWFTPSSGAVGAQRFTLVSTGFGDVAGGLFATGGHLYVSRLNGSLYRMSFDGGVPSGPQIEVSGPGTDGLVWRARAVFPGP